MAWINDVPPVRAYSLDKGIETFQGAPDKAFTHLVGVIDKYRHDDFVDAQYIIAGVWGELASENKARPMRVYGDQVVACVSYHPKETGRYKDREIFRRGEYDDAFRRKHPDVYSGFPKEFLDIIDVEEAHRKKAPDLHTYLRNPPKIEGKLLVDKICSLPPA